MTDNIYINQQSNQITVTESNNEVIVATSGYQGAKGSQILVGNGAPSSSLGLQGDFYIDKSSYYVYGPKISKFNVENISEGIIIGIAIINDILITIQPNIIQSIDGYNYSFLSPVAINQPNLNKSSLISLVISPSETVPDI
jgi:hypothetical protein